MWDPRRQWLGGRGTESSAPRARTARTAYIASASHRRTPGQDSLIRPQHPSGSSTQPPMPQREAPSRSLDLLNGGAEAFPKMLEAIARAQQRIHLEVYTFERDEVGVQFLGALQSAARRGVRVRVV